MITSLTWPDSFSCRALIIDYRYGKYLLEKDLVTQDQYTVHCYNATKKSIEHKDDSNPMVGAI